jgi:hypothetical protein
MRALEMVVLQFLVIVVLPNNGVGTPELPAVGATSVRCSADGCSTAPSKGEPATFVLLFRLESTEYVGEDFLVFSRHAAISAADVLQLSRRLRI